MISDDDWVQALARSIGPMSNACGMYIDDYAGHHTFPAALAAAAG